jgi:hypothetical protein
MGLRRCWSVANGHFCGPLDPERHFFLKTARATSSQKQGVAKAMNIAAGAIIPIWD